MIGTDHACKRYCERIIGMPTKAIPEYLEENKKEIQGYIRQLVEGSTFLYYGKTDPKYPRSSYYINDDIILINRGQYVRERMAKLEAVVDVTKKLLHEIDARTHTHSLQMDGLHGVTIRIKQGDKAYWETVGAYNQALDALEGVSQP